MPRRRISEEAVRLHTTITIPARWRKYIDEYMREKGYTNLAQLIRSLIFEHVVKERLWFDSVQEFMQSIFSHMGAESSRFEEVRKEFQRLIEGLVKSAKGEFPKLEDLHHPQGEVKEVKTDPDTRTIVYTVDYGKDGGEDGGS